MIDATRFLRLYAAYRLRSLERCSAAEMQERELLKLLRLAEGTRFAGHHDFNKIRSVSDYQQAVPLRTYEQFWTEYWKREFPDVVNCTWPGRIPYFAVSSGTSSGTTKYIPCTHEMVTSNAKAGIDLFVHHVANCPQSKLWSGKSFMLGGSTMLVKETEGVWSGDLSGIAMVTLPWWLRSRSFPSDDLLLLKNWEEKIDRMSRAALNEKICMLGGVPSWLLIFLGKYQELLPNWDGRISSVFPDLDLLVHGGVNFSHYRNQFLEILEGSQAEMREVYPASEGFIAVADRGYGEGLRLVLDHGIFYEFVPLEELGASNPTRHWVGNVETGINYAVVMTTCAGLWSYILGDTVRFVDTATPRILVTGRTSYYLSAFGEHLIAEEIEDAVSQAAEATGLEVAEYSVGAIYPKKSGDLGGHLYVVEFVGAPVDARTVEKFALVLDQRLQARNEDYMAHRAAGYGLKAPEIKVVPSGFFANWMKSRGKLGGQHKVPRIITDQTLLASLCVTT